MKQGIEIVYGSNENKRKYINIKCLTGLSITFSWNRGLAIKCYLNKAGYFDERPLLTLGFLLFTLYIHLPFHTGIDNCGDTTPGWGLYWDNFSHTLVFLWGRKRKQFELYYNDTVKTVYETPEGPIAVTPENSKEIEVWRKEFQDNLIHYNFTYTGLEKDGSMTVSKLTCIKTDLYYRKILCGIPLRLKKESDLWVEFNPPIRRTSGKGLKMLEGETPEQALRRVEVFRTVFP